MSLPLLLTAPEGVARGSDALTLLEYPETRNQFIDELMEVLSPGDVTACTSNPSPAADVRALTDGSTLEQSHTS